jgi:hypothetical protein
MDAKWGPTSYSETRILFLDAKWVPISYSEMRILFLDAKWGPNFLFCMSSTTTVSYWLQ